MSPGGRMLKRLTAKYVERLHVKKRAEIWDAQTHGLILRVAAGGVKSWCVLGYLRGSRRRVRIGIGRFPRWSLADARQEAGRILQELDRGRMRHRRGDPETDPTATGEALGNACVRAARSEEHTAELQPRVRTGWHLQPG